MNLAASTLDAVFEAAQGLADGEPCSDALMAAVVDAVEARREPGDPQRPTMTGLVVRRAGLPAWWESSGSLLLAAPDAGFQLGNGLGLIPIGRNLALAGSQSSVDHLVCGGGSGGLIALGDRVRLNLGYVATTFGGAILIGEDTTGRCFARVDVRNSSAIVVGADGMWGDAVNIVTDDMHAIRDVVTEQRVNPFGPRIVIGRHVWLGETARVLGGAVIGEGSVIGVAAMVRKGVLPPNSVCVGSPARPIRSDIVWTRDDSP